MLSIVNYGSSDSENEISDNEDNDQLHPPATTTQDDDLAIKTSKIHLPKPTTQKINIAEEDDEFLHKKAVPSLAPPKREKVKILIPRLSDFRDEEDHEKIVKIQPANRKTGLLSLLPKPSGFVSAAPAPKPQTAPSKPPTTQPIKEQPKKVGLIAYALMSHNPKTSEAAKKKSQDSDDDEDEPSGSFFTFASNEEDLPQVNDDEVKALVAKESARMEQRKRQHEGLDQEEPQNEEQPVTTEQSQEIDEEAMKALLGGNKAKRSRIDNIQFIDLSSAEVLPDRDEWLRRSLAGETSYMPTGNIVDKGPTALSKRKHQISYLSMRAENNEAELEAMWASNRQNKRETKSKYGF